MKTTIIDLLNSKKFVQALLGVIVGVAVRLGVPEIEVTEILAIISPLLASIGAQGFADMGKERVIAEEGIRRMNEDEA
tara:strand:+ start:1991 stop:2224 length:234 start_codon:yes stop_codon:yes gene_type:complete